MDRARGLVEPPTDTRVDSLSVLGMSRAPHVSSLSAPPCVEVGLTAIDSHTCGQMTRVVVDGAPDVGRLAVRDARDAFEREHDWIRRAITLEPRGQRSMFGTVLVPPVDPLCAVGAVFMDAERYPDMCGHATIGVATTVVALGLVDIGQADADGRVEFGIETPAGRVSVTATVDGPKVLEVGFVNQPAYYLGGVSIPGPHREDVQVEVAYGGQWYAFVEAAAFGVAVKSEQLGALIAAAEEVRAAIAENLAHVDPVGGAVPAVGNIVWVDAPVGDAADARNIPISPAGAYDRSPCGTATSARLAILHAQGKLGVDQPFVNQSIVDTVFRARIVETCDLSGHPAVVPEVTGAAWLTGKLEVWVDPDDPLREGFLVGEVLD
jgi:proline racemase